MDGFQYGKNIVFIAATSPKYFLDLSPRVELSLALNYFVKRRRLAKKLLDSYSQRTGLQGTALLMAHRAKQRGNVWMFQDGTTKVPIQDFVDTLDGKVCAILLHVCNCRNMEISSRKSIVVHADSDFRQLDLMHGYAMRIYVPKYGYVEHHHHRLMNAIRGSVPYRRATSLER